MRGSGIWRSFLTTLCLSNSELKCPLLPSPSPFSSPPLSPSLFFIFFPFTYLVRGREGTNFYLQMCVTLVDLTISAVLAPAACLCPSLSRPSGPSLSLYFYSRASKWKRHAVYKVSVSSGEKNSLSCNLGGNDLITDKRVFLRAWPCQTAPGAGTTAAAESLSCGAVHRHGAETVKLREPAALRGASCIFSPGLGSLLCSTSTLNATDNSGFWR